MTSNYSTPSSICNDIICTEEDLSCSSISNTNFKRVLVNGLNTLNDKLTKKIKSSSVFTLKDFMFFTSGIIDDKETIVQTIVSYDGEYADDFDATVDYQIDKKVIIISNTTSDRRMKNIVAAMRNYTIVHYLWLFDCISRKELLPFKNYSVDNRLHFEVDLHGKMLTYHYDLKSYMYDLKKSKNRKMPELFRGKKFYLLTFENEIWSNLIELCGGEVIKSQISVTVALETLDIIIFDSYEYGEVINFVNKNAEQTNLSIPRKYREAFKFFQCIEKMKSKDIAIDFNKILSTDWIVSSILSRKVIKVGYDINVIYQIPEYKLYAIKTVKDNQRYLINDVVVYTGGENRYNIGIISIFFTHFRHTVVIHKFKESAKDKKCLEKCGGFVSTSVSNLVQRLTVYRKSVFDSLEYSNIDKDVYYFKD